MTYRCIFKIFLFTKMLEAPRGASYVALGVNAALSSLQGGIMLPHRALPRTWVITRSLVQ
jgi:hypothetical protein